MRSPSSRSAAVFGLVAGLGLSHHRTVLFTLAPLIVVVAHRALRTEAGASPDRRRWAMAGLAGLGGGLLPYLYLPLAGADAGLLSMGDPTTAEGFADHVLRRDYGTFRLVGEQGSAGGGC